MCNNLSIKKTNKDSGPICMMAKQNRFLLVEAGKDRNLEDHESILAVIFSMSGLQSFSENLIEEGLEFAA